MTANDQIPSHVEDIAADIVRRCHVLLQEMGQLRERLFAMRGENQHISGLVTQMSSVRTEKIAAESFLASLKDERNPWKGNAEARFRSSNIPAVDQLWTIIKGHCRHITSVHHHVVAHPRVDAIRKKGSSFHESYSNLKPRKAKQTAGRKKTGDDGIYVSAVVDGDPRSWNTLTLVICRDIDQERLQGAEWLKIISKTEKRLLHELAEGGWDWGVEADESSVEEEDNALFEDIEILRSATLLVRAARTNWHNYRHPRIRFVFTRIREGQDKEVDRLIRKLRLVGGEDISVAFHFADSEWVTCDPPDIDTAIANLLPQDDDITDPVLLDTSVLIALVSDISHTRVEQQVWHGVDVVAQIKAEQSGLAFLWHTAYPRIHGRTLLCTKEAFRQFSKINGIMGSPAEVERARLLFHGPLEDFERLSTHPVPKDLMLPVQILHDKETNFSAASLVQTGSLPPVALEIQRQLQLTENQYTHLYGWITGLTVITGNRVLAGKIVRIIEESLEQENNNRGYDHGPRICALSQNRALATRGPSRKKAHKLAQEGLWPLLESADGEMPYPESN